MTNERLNFEEYQYSALAARLTSSEEGQTYIPGALEALAGKDGFDLGENAEGFVRGALATEEGIKTALNTYAPEFKKRRDAYTPGDLVTWYDSVLSDLDDEQKEVILRTLNSATETIGEINTKFKKAARVVKDQKDPTFKGNYSPEEVSAALKTMRDYEGIMSTMEILDEYKFKELEIVAVENKKRSDLEKLASQL
jgi:hypothetical protein